jgi:uridylate kinase
MTTPKYKRILLKLSGEALMGNDAYGINPQTMRRLRGDQGGCRHGCGNRCRDRRWQHLSRHGRYGHRDGSRHRGLHGHAGHGDERHGAVRMRCVKGAECPRAVGAEYRAGGRALHPWQGHPLSGRGQDCDFRCRNRQPLLHDRYRCSIARLGNRCGNRAQGDQGRWHLYGRSEERSLPRRATTKISFNEAISKNLAVMDATAFALCRDQKLPINVFSIFKTGALKRVVCGENEGTLVYC